MTPAHVNGLDAPATSIRIKVGAQEYEPRWSFLAEYQLSLQGLTLKDVLDEVNSRGKRSAALMAELLAACLAHHFPSGAAPVAAHWAAQIGPKQLTGIWEGLIKAGRASGAIVDVPQEGKPPLAETGQTAPTA